MLNSRAEFNRSRIPRLIIEEQDIEEQERAEAEREQKINNILDREQRSWERRKTRERDAQHQKETGSYYKKGAEKRALNEVEGATKCKDRKK